MALPSEARSESAQKPTGRVTNQELIEYYGLNELHGTTPEIIIQLSGIEARYIAKRNETLASLGALSVIEAIEDAGLPEGTEIGKLFLGTATEHTHRPISGSHVEIQDLVTEAGWPILDSTENVRACGSWTEQLVMGYSTVGNDWFDIAAITGAETLSRATDFRDKNTGPLFGDGAATFILSKTEREEAGLLGAYMSTDGSKRDQTYQRPSGKINMVDNRGLYRDSVDALVTGTTKALEAAELEMDEIDLVVPHQANLRIIETARKKLQIPEDKVVITVNQFGNTSSASKPMAFHVARQEGRVPEGITVLFCDVGIGMSTVAAIIRT